MATVTYFDSIDDAVDMLSKRSNINWVNPHEGKFSGASSVQEFNDLLLYGDPVKGEKIKAMIDQHQVSLRTLGQRQQLDVAGAMPSVPHMLGGDPMHMRRKKPEMINRGRIRMFVNIVVSAGVSEQQLMNRGAAIAALAYNLSTVRPVELWAIGTMDEPKKASRPEDDYNIPCIRLAANPIDPNRIASILAHAVGARALMFNLRSVAKNESIHWAWADYSVQCNADKFKERMTPILNLEKDDIVLPGGMLGDIASQPGKWLKDKMKQLGILDESEA